MAQQNLYKYGIIPNPPAPPVRVGKNHDLKKIKNQIFLFKSIFYLNQIFLYKQVIQGDYK